MDYYFGYFYVLAYVGGLLMYYIAFNTLEDAVEADGRYSNNLWNTGLVVYATLPYVYNFYVLLETRRISFPILLSYAVSTMMFMPLCIHLVNTGDN